MFPLTLVLPLSLWYPAPSSSHPRSTPSEIAHCAQCAPTQVCAPSFPLGLQHLPRAALPASLSVLVFICRLPPYQSFSPVIVTWSIPHPQFPISYHCFFLSLYMALISCMYVIFISCNFLTLSSLFITVFCPWLFLPHPFHIFLLTTDLMSFPSPRSSSRPICSHSSPGYLHPNYTIETLAVFLK